MIATMGADGRVLGPGHPQRFLKKLYNGRAPTKLWQEVSGNGNFR